MRVLVATSKGQGLAPHDICRTIDGELVVLQPAVCAGAKCRRVLLGLTSGKGTTTFEAVERPDIDEPTYCQLVREGLAMMGHEEDPNDPADRWLDLLTDEMLEMAAHFPIGVVLERRDWAIGIRPALSIQ